MAIDHTNSGIRSGFILFVVAFVHYRILRCSIRDCIVSLYGINGLLLLPRRSVYCAVRTDL